MTSPNVPWYYTNNVQPTQQGAAVLYPAGSMNPMVAVTNPFALPAAANDAYSSSGTYLQNYSSGEYPSQTLASQTLNTNIALSTTPATSNENTLANGIFSQANLTSGYPTQTLAAQTSPSIDGLTPQQLQNNPAYQSLVNNFMAFAQQSPILSTLNPTQLQQFAGQEVTGFLNSYNQVNPTAASALLESGTIDNETAQEFQNLLASQFDYAGIGSLDAQAQAGSANTSTQQASDANANNAATQDATNDGNSPASGGNNYSADGNTGSYGNSSTGSTSDNYSGGGNSTSSSGGSGSYSGPVVSDVSVHYDGNAYDYSSIVDPSKTNDHMPFRNDAVVDWSGSTAAPLPQTGITDATYPTETPDETQERQTIVNYVNAQLQDQASGALTVNERSARYGIDTNWDNGNNPNYGPWCAAFATTSVLHGDPKNFVGHDDYVPSIVNKAVKNGQWGYPGSYTPKPGDLIIFNEGVCGQDHVGVVLGVKNGQVEYAAGNQGGQIAHTTVAANSKSITGYVNVVDKPSSASTSKPVAAPAGVRPPSSAAPPSPPPKAIRPNLNKINPR